MSSSLRSWSLVALLALLLAGCDPFETEIALKPDGSGRMTVRLHLSAPAQVLIKDYAGPRMRGYRPPLTEEMASAWSEANAESGVRLVSYSSKAAEDGSRRIAYVVEFKDLRALSETVWGWPLQLAVTAGEEGLEVLQFDDPVRFAVKVMLSDKVPVLTPPPPVGEPGGVEYAAFLELFSRLAMGVRTRVKIELPGPARSAQGATLSADRKTVLLESASVADPASVAAWLQGKPAAVVVPAGVVALKRFSPVPAVNPDQPFVILRSIEVGEKEGFSFALNQIRININRNINYQTGGEPQALLSQTMSVVIQLFNTGNLRLLNTDKWPQERQPVHMLSAARDSLGNDLRSAGSSFTFAPNFPVSARAAEGRGPIGNVHGVEQPFGTLNITLKAPHPEAKAISLLEGYVSAYQLVEEGQLELRPLKDCLNRDYYVMGSALRFLSIKGQQVEYSVSQRGERFSWSLMFDNMPFYAGDGSLLRRAGSSGRVEAGRYIYQLNFPAPFPEDGYVVITYPAVIREIRIPFSFKDIKLP